MVICQNLLGSQKLKKKVLNQSGGSWGDRREENSRNKSGNKKKLVGKDGP